MRIMAEMSLVHGDPDLGALMLAHGESRVSVHFADQAADWSTRWKELENVPVSVGSMLLWFGPLIHELGHVAARSGKLAAIDRSLGDGILQAAFDHTLNGFPYPDALKDQIRSEFLDPASASSVRSATPGRCWTQATR